MILGEDSIYRAVETILNHEIVALPTETVYGLAGLATSEIAINKIFRIKNRPADNPTIAHFADVQSVNRFVKLEEALKGREKLLDLWPGPITLILPVRDSRLLTASRGQHYCGVRIPAHPVTLEIIRLVDQPLAMPSANKSGHCSPVTAEHVQSDFGDSILIIDGGETVYGIESTILSLIDKPTILRVGAVPVDVIASILHVDPATLTSNATIVAPGVKYRHYAPSVPVLFYGSEEEIPGNKQTLLQQAKVIQISEETKPQILRKFYSILREAEQAEQPVFFIGALDKRRFPDYVILDRLSKMLV